VGTWEEYEAEQAAIEARRAQYPAAIAALRPELLRAWPPHPIDPPAATWTAFGDDKEFRAAIAGKAWPDFPVDVVRREYDMMSLLPIPVLAELLPAWLRVAVEVADASNVSGTLVFTLGSPSRGALLRDALDDAQRAAVIHTLEALAMRWAGKPSEREVNDLLATWRA